MFNKSTNNNQQLQEESALDSAKTHDFPTIALSPPAKGSRIERLGAPSRNLQEYLEVPASGFKTVLLSGLNGEGDGHLHAEAGEGVVHQENTAFYGAANGIAQAGE